MQINQFAYNLGRNLLWLVHGDFLAIQLVPKIAFSDKAVHILVLTLYLKHIIAFKRVMRL